MGGGFMAPNNGGFEISSPPLATTERAVRFMMMLCVARTHVRYDHHSLFLGWNSWKEEYSILLGGGVLFFSCCAK